MYNMFKVHEALGAMPWLILALSRLANAACECGYSINQTSDASHAVFTNLVENDFLHTAGDNLTEFGWAPQEYNVSSKEARGPYGKEFEVGNADLNPLKDASAWTGEGEKGGDTGLRLWVRGDHSHGFVNGAELASMRHDMLYGSFRVGMKLSAQNGTCGAFFWFWNNSQEIDMEFLSKQFTSNSGVVNLVLQSPESVRAGYDASNTPNYHVQPLSFSPDDNFHEYRFDWTPERVAFYVDGQFTYQMIYSLPTSAGRLFLNHWSNGDPRWSAGPPETDTAMTVSYVKAYFNSSDTSQNEMHKNRCATFDASKVCQIPEQTKAPVGDDAKTYFFSQDGGDKTPGQTVYRTTNGASGRTATAAVWVAIAMSVFSWAML